MTVGWEVLNEDVPILTHPQQRLRNEQAPTNSTPTNKDVIHPGKK